MRLGRSTTIKLRIQIAPHGEVVPPPLIEAELRYPAGLDVQLSGLGIDACSTSVLETFGPSGCPPDSVMGYGSAVAELPIKRKAVRETAHIMIFRTDEQEGRLTMLLYVYGETALSAQVVLPTQLLPAARPFGGLLRIRPPLIPAFPEGSDVSVTDIRLVIGPKSLTYTERAHHRLIRYKPAGIGLPGYCPRGGFPFAIALSFLGGSTAQAKTAVRCPAKTTQAALRGSGSRHG